MKKVFAYIDHIERLEFYNRFVSKEVTFHFFTARLSVYLKAKNKGLNIELLSAVENNMHDLFDETRCREVMSGTLKLLEAKKLSLSVFNYLESFDNIASEISCFMIWNGSDVVDQVVKKWCATNSIRMIFMEISNLPGKLFVDSKGVNAASQLCSCDESFFSRIENVDKVRLDKFINNYMKIKSGKYIPPQAKLASKTNFWFLLDYFSSVIKITPKTQSESLLKKILVVFSRFRTNKTLPEIGTFPNSKYCFLPLQLSNDSQILLNSSVDNEAAILNAIEYSKKNKLKLVVKPHPAEKDRVKLERYIFLAKKYDFCITSRNTNDIIESSETIITINSTVGLESIIFGKEVIFLGRTFYEKMHDRRVLEIYIENYLFNCDYFSFADVDFDSLYKHCNRIREYG